MRLIPLGRMAAPLALAALISVPAAAADGLGASLQLLDGGKGEDGRYLAGLEIDLEPGWKTYWRMPGEGGLPPGFDWSQSENVASVEVLWPTPRRLEDAYGDAIGYDQRVILPLSVEPRDANAPVELSVTGLIGVCEKICVPLDVALTETLDPNASGGRIGRHLDSVPRSATPEEAAAISVTAAPDGTVLHLDLPASVTDVFATGHEVANGLSEGDGSARTIELSRNATGDAPVTLTVIDGAEAYELRLDGPHRRP